ncbi:hypothetical protein PRIC2_003389 [Phytophthora ramorum]
MIDLNTPTFHSKETLVHLTVKNNHRSMFYQLCSFGADIYIKDGNERRVCDVTTDRKWVRELKDFIAEIEQSRTKRDSSKNRDAILRHESMLHAERLRQSVTSQRDEERRLALENTEGDLGEVSSLLKDLLVSDGSEVDMNDESDRATLIKESLEQTAVVFVRLRDPHVPVNEKHHELEILVEACPHPNRINTTDRRVRTPVATEAAQIIHVLQKFHRVDHAAIMEPALDPVRKLRETTPVFANFVLSTSKIFASVDRKSQARDILEVLEKRLVKTSFAPFFVV